MSADDGGEAQARAMAAVTVRSHEAIARASLEEIITERDRAESDLLVARQEVERLREGLAGIAQDAEFCAAAWDNGYSAPMSRIARYARSLSGDPR